MSKSKGTASKQRDEARERLKALASAATAPGQRQAARALEGSAREDAPKSQLVEPTGVTHKVIKGSRAIEGETRKGTRTREKRAEKISVSLHPQDQARAEKVEDALRKAGLIPRRASTSFLLKVALAAFEEKNVENLRVIVEQVKAQDGRGKWMHSLKGSKIAK